MSGKVLVAYFSASGTTAKTAKKLSKAVSADLYEIKPEVPYTSGDLNWMDKKSRSTLEMNDPSSRPAIAEKLQNMEQYDVVFVGFPIWWGTAPRIIQTFLERYDLGGKTIYTFCTSGGSGIGQSISDLSEAYTNINILSGHRFHTGDSTEAVQEWLDSLK